MKVKLTVLKGICRSNYHKTGDTFIVDDLCPSMCHELWQRIYPSVYTLKNGGTLDFGDSREKKFIDSCPDGNRVQILGEVVKE